MLLPLLAFVFGSLVVAAAAVALMPRRGAAIDRRIEELTLGRAPEEDGRPRLQSLIGLFKRIGEKAPHSPKEMGSLRLRLPPAGDRPTQAPTTFLRLPRGVAA